MSTKNYKNKERSKNNMPMPRDFTVILYDLVEEETLDVKEVFHNLINWLSEEDVHRFCHDNYYEVTNLAYEEKYDLQEDESENDAIRDYCLECGENLEWVFVEEEAGEVFICKDCFSGR